MGIYTIKKVPVSEADKLVSFIDTHWKKGHALVKSKALLDFQHLNKDDNTYNFIVAENNETKEYDALVGFIPTSQYDTKLAENGDYWGAIWKYREDVDNDEINNAAFFIWRKIFKQPYFQSYGAIGISKIAKRIYEVSRIPVVTMNQFYIANQSVESFKIGANLKKGNTSDSSVVSNIKPIDLTSLTDNDVGAYYRPLKSVDYIRNRYQRHPIYHYFFVGVYTGNLLNAVFVIRKVWVECLNVLRVVDVLGDLSSVGSIYDDVQILLNENGSEYLDFMNYGIEDDVFKRMGFEKLDVNQNSVIVPNYFEPFERKNVLMEMGYKTKEAQYVAFKGDSDQDRPNIITNKYHYE